MKEGILSPQEERVREEKRLAEIMEENNHKIAEAQRKLVRLINPIWDIYKHSAVHGSHELCVLTVCQYVVTLVPEVGSE